MDEYLHLMTEELGSASSDLRAPQWSKAELAPDVPFTVAIVGAGMSGIAAAYRLKQAGVEYIVIEKNHDFGGTWLENTYPGCRVDVPNHLYSYSFAQNDDWPQNYSTQQVLLEYFQRCADGFGLRDHTRFSTEVTQATWDEDRALWRIEVRTADGTDVIEAQALISAVGQLNRPKYPDIAGMDRFAGPSFHSAEWDHDVDLDGKKVAVIGTGASAAQFIPIVAETAEHLTVFQRTPNWLAPTFDYHDEVPEGQRWMFTHVPFYAHWYRFWLFWRFAEGMLPAVTVDPEWMPNSQSVSAMNDELRTMLVAYIEMQFPSDPELAAKVVPHYPPGAKRIVRDNGIWAQTLQRPNVSLVTEKISEITAEGVMAADGELHEADVIIYGTGFTASQFLTPMKVVGRDSVDLHEQWDGNARAYLGVTVPHMPNFFILYGPNTNIVVNGSIIYFSECEVHYALECIRMLFEQGKTSFDTKVEVHDSYNQRIDAGNAAMAWGASDVNSWYKSASGRVAQNWPFSLLEFWQQTRKANSRDYELR